MRRRIRKFADREQTHNQTNKEHRRIEIGPFKNDNEYIYDGKEICESLKCTKAFHVIA